jgi:hypothetical protein
MRIGLAKAGFLLDDRRAGWLAQDAPGLQHQRSGKKFHGRRSGSPLPHAAEIMRSRLWFDSDLARQRDISGKNNSAIALRFALDRRCCRILALDPVRHPARLRKINRKTANLYNSSCDLF